MVSVFSNCSAQLKRWGNGEGGREGGVNGGLTCSLPVYIFTHAHAGGVGGPEDVGWANQHSRSNPSAGKIKLVFVLLGATVNRYMRLGCNQGCC